MKVIIPRMLLNKTWKLMMSWNPSSTLWWNTSFPGSIMGGIGALTRITSQETHDKTVSVKEKIQ